jgi:hypothetical protein
MSVGFYELFDGEDIVVVESFELKGHSLSLRLLSSKDVGGEFDGTLPVGKVDHHGEVLIFLYLVWIDHKEEATATDIGRRDLQGGAIQHQFNFEAHVEPLEETLLTLVHEKHVFFIQSHDTSPVIIFNFSTENPQSCQQLILTLCVMYLLNFP